VFVQPGGLSHAVELVQLIRSLHGDYFCIVVAGYPEVHSECWEGMDNPSQEAADLDMAHLKVYQPHISLLIRSPRAVDFFCPVLDFFFCLFVCVCLFVVSTASIVQAKVDAGADFIITQLFYDTSAYINFTTRATKAGIKCPIIPGYMPVQARLYCFV
jgi:methylenetetrahydrofolate reductase (NADPH)